MTRDLGNRKSNPGGKKGKGKFHGDSCVIGLGCQFPEGYLQGVKKGLPDRVDVEN